MTSFVARLGLAFVLLWGIALTGARADEVPAPVVLGKESISPLTLPVQVLLERADGLTIDQISRSGAQFQTKASLARQPLDPNSALWIRLRLVRADQESPKQWSLIIPMPFVDEAVLYHRSGDGRWATQRAGDTLAQSEWSQRGLYPEFALNLDNQEPQEVFLRIRNFKHLSTPLLLVPAAERQGQRNTELLALGLAMGILGVLVVLSLIRYAEHRSLTDLGAAGFSALTLLTSAQINGVLNATVFAHTPHLADYAYSTLPSIAVGASLLFVRKLYAISTHYAHYDNFLRAIGLGTIASALTYAFDRGAADRIGAIVLLVATTAGLVATFLSWRGNSRIWYWLMAAYIPQYLCLLRMMCEALGWVPIWWEMRYLLSASIALSVPVLVYALARVTHDRKELLVRARHLPTQDALTGLLTREAFTQELHTAYDRVIDGREPMAVVVVRVVNYAHIVKGLGAPLAENSLLRGVVKLHRILRDVDPAGRVATDAFGLILEGVSSRQTLTERMVQLIGSGLIPLPGLTPPITLQFHAACLLLHEHPLLPEEAIQSLEELLAGMSDHTRRPIRFLDPPQTMPAPMMASSSLP